MYNLNDLMKLTFSNQSFIDQMINFNVLQKDVDSYSIKDIKNLLVIKLLQQYNFDFTLIDLSEIITDLETYEDILTSYFIYNNVSKNNIKIEETVLQTRKFNIISFKEQEESSLIKVIDPITNETIFLESDGEQVSIKSGNFIELTYSGFDISNSVLMYFLLTYVIDNDLKIKSNLELFTDKNKTLNVNIKVPLVENNDLKLNEISVQEKKINLNKDKLVQFLSLNSLEYITTLFPGTLNVIHVDNYLFVENSFYELNSILIDKVTIVTFENVNEYLNVVYKIEEKKKLYYVTINYDVISNVLKVTIKDTNLKSNSNTLFEKINIFKKDNQIKPSYINMIDIIENNLIN